MCVEGGGDRMCVGRGWVERRCVSVCGGGGGVVWVIRGKVCVWGGGGSGGVEVDLDVV